MNIFTSYLFTAGKGWYQSLNTMPEIVKTRKKIRFKNS